MTVRTSAPWAALQSSGLFTPNQLANCATNGPGGTPTEADVVDFIKPKHKVRSAMAVAKVFDEATARKIKSVENVLVEIADK
ncbi:hypothetical protein [Haloactinopolyspora alba]|uniref:hypothetical protein n=1 Tax=Haloactinopolyspora alba TaxID=648780 RepID=UPI00101B811F|nr:hypothetical protein [Haloactinopolyspora alba]